MSRMFNSIRFRVWVLFIGFSASMLLFLYIQQVVFLPTFYNFVKTQESVATAYKIRRSWNSADLTDEIYVLAKEQDMLIAVEFINSQIPFSYVQDPNNSYFSIQNYTNETVREKIRSAKNGMYTEEIAVEGERTALVLSTYAGTQNNIEGYITIINFIEPLDNTLDILQSQFFMNASVLLVAAFILSAFVVTRISNPIIKITKNAKKLTTGEFHMDIKASDYTEIKLLADNLNKASNEIAKTENLRKDLIANVSHDLKTPLTMIKAYAEMIRDLSGNNPEKRERHLQVIVEEADRLNGLVVDMLDLSKIQSGVAEKNITSFDFSEHLRGLMKRFNYLTEAGDYEITADIEDGMIIKADITKLEQVVYNLVNNAINYTGEDGKVKVRLYKRKPQTGRFEVTDSGAGIAKEELPYIWERYYKAEKSENHKRTAMGTGLGLSIVKGVLEMHGFAYGADSTLKKGSTFWFEFPC